MARVHETPMTVSLPMLQSKMKASACGEQGNAESWCVHELSVCPHHSAPTTRKWDWCFLLLEAHSPTTSNLFQASLLLQHPCDQRCNLLNVPRFPRLSQDNLYPSPGFSGWTNRSRQKFCHVRKHRQKFSQLLTAYTRLGLLCLIVKVDETASLPRCFLQSSSLQVGGYRVGGGCCLPELPVLWKSSW